MKHIDRTEWMTEGYGLMNHWLYPAVLPEKNTPARSLDEAVDQFNLDRMLADFAQSGADWLIFTLGQNTGYYISPSQVIDELAGPGHCSRRDLALEIAQGVHHLGKRFIAYLPCELAANTTLQAGFAWNTVDGTDQAEFQSRYARLVREWAERLGTLLDGWWFDGCYNWSIFHNSHMDWDLWLNAARAGNPLAAVTFNDGSFCVGNVQPIFTGHDYLAGEAEMLANGRIRLGRSGNPPPTHLPKGRFAPGTNTQWHTLLPIDCFWGHGNPPPDWLPGHPYHPVDPHKIHFTMEPPIYPDQELKAFLDACLDVGGAVTFNIGIFQEGHYGKATLEQLKRLGA
jgi:hypothetical protein